MTQEFERAQHDPDYLAWLEAMDSELNRFLARDAPAVDALDQPYCEDGFALCEDAIRERFGTLQAVNDPANTELADRFTRFIGEVHRRATEARWVNTAHMDKEMTRPHPQLLFSFIEFAFDPPEQIRGAFVTKPQQPSQLVWVLGNNIDEYNRWVGFGRPSVDEFNSLYLQQLVAEDDGADV